MSPTQVSFRRSVDSRSGKAAATRLQRLAPGTVQFETLGLETLSGVVTRAVVGTAGRQEVYY